MTQIKYPVFRYHATKGAVKFADISEAPGEDDGWYDSPAKIPGYGKNETETEAQVKPSSDKEEIVQLRAVINKHEAFDAQVQIALGLEGASKTEVLAKIKDVMEASKLGQTVIDEPEDGSATIAELFQVDPVSLTVDQLFAYGKQIGAPVHHKHKDARLIEIIQAHLDASTE